MERDTTPGEAPPRFVRLLTLSAALALGGLAVSALHFLWPTPLMFTLFMFLGQGLFGAAMVLYAVVIIRDLKRKRVL